MNRPNFFADLDVLNCLLGMQYEATAQPAMDLTVDLPELPFWFCLKNEAKTRKLTLYTQMELYTKDENSAVEKGSVTLDDASGNAQVRAPQGLGENMAAFYIACRNLSLFAKENGLEKLWGDADPEQTGILLTAENGTLRWKIVSGAERPDLTVERMFGGITKMRPYMDDFWDRSETEMMPLEDRIKKAENGDKFAIAKLATAYLNGDDEVEQDAAKAAYWYRKEAELQDSEGAFNLGLLTAKGFGVERDFAQAAEWMEKAVAWGDEDGKGPAAQYRAMAENLKKAEAGDAEAMAELAEGYMGLGGSLDQAGSEEDYRECLRWAKKSADLGCAAGCWPLALAYEHGRGVKQDKEKALELYRKGAEGGDARCQHSYGCFLMRGELVKKDEKEAFRLFEKSADQGYGLACRALGHMYETGEGVDPDFEKELAYYEKACEDAPNDAEFLRHVGFQYTNLMEDREQWLHGVERAAYWLRKAADLGDGTAAGGAEMYEGILSLYRQGIIPAGTDLGECMEYLSGKKGKKPGDAVKKTASKEKTEQADRLVSALNETIERKKAAQEKAERERAEKERREQEERERQEKAAREERLRKEAEEARRQEEERRKAEEARRQEEERLKKEAEEKQKELDRLNALREKETALQDRKSGYAEKRAELAAREAAAEKKEEELFEKEAKILQKEALLAAKGVERDRKARKKRRFRKGLARLLIVLLLAAAAALYFVPQYVLHEDPIAFIRRVIPAEIPGIGALSSAGRRETAPAPSAAPKPSAAPTPRPAATATPEPAMTAKEMLQQGDRYYTGNGVPQDYAKAVEWYTKAAEAGNLTAQFNLGLIYEKGRGVKQDYAQAVSWYTKAAEQGAIEAQYNLGLCCYYGNGVPQNYTKAAEWFTKAAEAGNEKAQYNLGICCYYGRGVPQNYTKGAEWFTKAAGQGYATAQYNMGICYENGNGVPQDYKKAAEWYLKAAEQGYASAQYNLGLCCYYGNGVPEDHTKAAEWFTKAAEQGDASAQYNLGVCYERGSGVPQNYTKAAEWFTKAADQGDEKAKDVLERLKKEGKI